MELKTYFAQDRNGSLIPSANVTIYLTGTATLASGLTSVSGSPLSNPFTADADGKIQFRAPDGIYDMQVSLGSTSGVKVTFQCVDVEQQLSDANSAAVRAEAAAASIEGLSEDIVLKSDLASDTGYKLVPSLNTINSEVPCEMFRSVSADDQGTLQNAIDYATSKGWSVFLETDKTYQVETLTVSCPIRGFGIIERKAGTSSTLINMATGGKLKDVTIDGLITSGTDSVGNIMCQGLTDIILKNIKSINAGGHNLTIRDTPEGGSNVVKDSYISCTRVGYGIYLRNVRGEKVKNTKITGCASDGLVLSNSSFIETPLEISGVESYGNGGNGIATQFLTTSTTPAGDQVKIVKCRTHDNGHNGIVCQTSHSIVANNHSYRNGTTTSHQGMLFNGQYISSSNNISYNNTGVGFDFGDCRDSSSTGDIAHDNGWLGFEINACENFALTGFVARGNLKGKVSADLQAGVLVHKGTGGYVFTGESKNIVVSNGVIGSGGGGQKYAIEVDENSYDVIISGVCCANAGLTDDIFTKSRRVVTQANTTRWDPMNDARVTIASTIEIPSVADVVQLNGTGTISNINIQNGGAFVRNRYVRLVAPSANGFTLVPGGNISIGENYAVGAGYSVLLWSKGNGAWHLV